jgi:hypothetical protein
MMIRVFDKGQIDSARARILESRTMRLHHRRLDVGDQNNQTSQWLHKSDSVTTVHGEIKPLVNPT